MVPQALVELHFPRKRNLVRTENTGQAFEASLFVKAQKLLTVKPGPQLTYSSALGPQLSKNPSKSQLF